MQLTTDTRTDVIQRLRRVEGQIRGIIAMLESGREPAELVQQLASASHAVRKARLKIVAHSARDCMTPHDSDHGRGECLEWIEQQFFSLT
jgi:DNA-binding FrmR family transcriptional regulator